MFGLENVIKKVTALLPGTNGEEGTTKEPKDDKKDDKKDEKEDDMKNNKKDDKKEETKKDKAKKPEPAKPVETYNDYLIACVDSHAGYLAPAIKGLALSLDTSLITIGFALSIILLAIHLSLPIFMTPHFSALITLFIPIQSTIIYIKNNLRMPGRVESKRPEPSKIDKITNAEKDEVLYNEEYKKWEEREEKRKVDEIKYRAARRIDENGVQWIWFWVFYVVVNGVRGFVGVYRPGWKGWYEVWRSVVLVVVAGPWYTKVALMEG